MTAKEVIVYDVVSVGPGRDTEVIARRRSLDDAIKIAREFAAADAHGGPVIENCSTAPEDLAAFGAEGDALPIYVVRAT